MATYRNKELFKQHPELTRNAEQSLRAKLETMSAITARLNAQNAADARWLSLHSRSVELEFERMQIEREAA